MILARTPKLGDNWENYYKWPKGPYLKNVAPPPPPVKYALYFIDHQAELAELA